MRIDRRFITVLVVSLFWAALVAAVFSRLAGTGSSPTRAETQKQIVVAGVALPVGSVIDAASVRLRAVPESLAPAGAYVRVDDVVGRPVISAIQPEEPVVDARIAAKGSGIGLAPMIPPGMRAIAVRVNDVVGVAGFVLPGMRVDVLVTARLPNQADTLTRTVLQNIAVLSAGQTLQTDGKSQSIAAPVVTLLVSPSDAEALTLANNEGHIQLVLRNSMDAETPATYGRRMREIFGAVRVVPPDDPPPPPRQPRSVITRAAAREIASAPAATPKPAAPSDRQMIVMLGKEQKLVVFRGGDEQ